MSPQGLWRWAQLKGLNVIGTGDFTHPLHFKELMDKLKPLGDGLFMLKKEFQKDLVPDSVKSEVHFILSAEVSCIYAKHGRVKKIHSIILSPGFAEVIKINKRLSKIGNLDADGRPILGMDVKDLLKIILDISEKNILIPAHAWTPHFSIFGSESGFDSIEDCFEELSENIYSIETGLSSDPLMNWRLSKLHKITLTSNSDAHSPQKIGREANIFDTDISYDSIIEAIKTGKGFLGTIEFFPEEGKYHYDGHRLCNVRLKPSETIKKYNGICPVCNKRLTVGVLHRVEKLSDLKEGSKPLNAPQYYYIIPLIEIIGEILDSGVNSKKVMNEYMKVIEMLGNEFRILLDLPIEEIRKTGMNELTEAILKMRRGEVHIEPGFDGVYGKISITGKGTPSFPVEEKDAENQMSLF